MPITETHEIHNRRLGRNIGVALTLAAFVAVVFFLTVSKVRNGGSVEAYDHTVRPSITEEDSQ
ncbi:MAG: hypothetical protein COW55_13750 [Rhodobacteraceae bacterium CG17_big_fil_post_rev_8_21_14_2_50_65_11]|nr:MAG: hypothetical protein COW55_13750 [Rhodobacteraceae bacterium CG17_big_fil_post_rev_8_21_14_2_50_65_11]